MPSWLSSGSKRTPWRNQSIRLEGKRSFLHVRDFLSLAGVEVNFKGKIGGWRKSSESLRNLRKPLNFIRKVDND